MPAFTRTITVDLKPDEVGTILREALGLPKDARVNFKIGSINHEYDDRYDSQGCTGVSLTYEETSELQTGRRVSPSPFDGQERR